MEELDLDYKFVRKSLIIMGERFGQSLKGRGRVVSVAIESTLLKKGGIPLLDQANYGLYKKFKSSVAECHEHPEYLKVILQEIFGVDHQEITDSIVKELTAFNYDDKVMQFIETVS